MSTSTTETASKPAAGRYSQFTLSTLFFAVTLSAVTLTAWRYSGVAGLLYVATAVAAIYLARHSITSHYGALLGTLVGANLIALLGITLAFLDDWMYSFGIIEVVILIGCGAIVGFGGSAYACFRSRQWGQMISSKSRRRQAIVLSLFGGLLGLCLASPWALEWYKLTRPDANISTYGVGKDGEQVCLFLGQGMNDQLLVDRLRDISTERRHSLVFRYTTVTDKSVNRLLEFKNTVSLDLRGTLITEEGERKLRVGLPACLIRR